MAAFKAGIRTVKRKLSCYRVEGNYSALSSAATTSIVNCVTREVQFLAKHGANYTTISNSCKYQSKFWPSSCWGKAALTVNPCKQQLSEGNNTCSTRLMSTTMLEVKTENSNQRDSGIHSAYTKSLLSSFKLAGVNTASMISGVGPGISRPQFGDGVTTNQCRRLQTKSDNTRIQFDSDVEDIIKMLDDKKKGAQVEANLTQFTSGWLIRLANENGYLSWCRNAYIATVVGVTVYVQEPVIPYAKEVAFVFMLMGAVNMIGGTGSFVHNILHLRKRLYMSSVSTLYHVALAVCHLFLWLFAVILYIGYVEEEKDELSSPTDNETK